ncbi:Stk1 family PASTA domain-containing Ser/Thr kinase [soil metagenome]
MALAYTRRVSVNTTDPMIGRLIDGRYQVRSRIARGGMATVYLATDLRLERRVAVKVMHGHLADDTQFRERFIQEARSAARLAHPNVVNVFDQGQDADSAYLVMEYLPGITLRDLLQEYGSLTPEQTIDITEAVLAGLAAAHKAGIVHRDLKPENVLLADDGRIKIGDFGLARAASANTATGAALLGTIAYLSPELITRGVADTRSDIYAVGIMMFEMLAGDQPYKGDQPMQVAYQHANETVPAPSTVNAKVPPELDELVLWATSPDPENRPRDARAMLDQLRETDALLKAAPSSSTTSQRTMVMPSSLTAPTTPMHSTAPHSTAETQVLGRRGSIAAAAPVADATSALATASTKRRRRGVWLAIVIVLLVAIAGTTGWYFGIGPGSKVTIPDTVAGQTPDQATATLEDLGLKVNAAYGAIDSPTIAAGAVAQTDPGIGSSVAKDGRVTLLLSTGPKPIPFTITQGMTEDDAKAAIDTAPWKLADTQQRFDPAIPLGSVIDVLGADGTTSILGQPTYGEDQELTLVLSAGPLTDVTGMPFSDAVAALAQLDVTATQGSQDYSDTVPEGSVIKIELSDGQVVAPGSDVLLQTSNGPAPVDMPNIVGMTWDKAKAALAAAGLNADYNHGADDAADLVTVKSTDPDAGTPLHRGDTVKVRFTV